MLRSTFVIATLMAALAAPAPLHAQRRGTSIVAKIDTIKVMGDVPTPLLVSMADLKALPRTKLTMEENGRQVTYEGVLAAELLKKAGAPMGEALRGKALASYVLAKGTDGYEVLLSLVELDTDLTASTVMVADSVDGRPIDERNGPFRLIVPKDSHPSRSVRMLEQLEVVRLRK